jgi:hypothetical protein
MVILMKITKIKFLSCLKKEEGGGGEGRRGRGGRRRRMKRKKKKKNPSSVPVAHAPVSKITRTKWTEGVAQMVECLLYKHKVLSSNSGPTRKRRRARLWIATFSVHCENKSWLISCVHHYEDTYVRVCSAGFFCFVLSLR